jgi:adenylate cyclase class 1
LPTQTLAGTYASFAAKWIHLQQHLLADIKTYLSPARRQLFDILPVYFHMARSRLPGHATAVHAPHGIPGYHPDPHLALWLGGKQSSAADSGQDSPSIRGIYLMGSATSILAFCPDSDIDVWICHQPSGQTQRTLLREKASQLERWAASQGIELHIYLVDTECFRKGDNGRVDSDSCGSLQQHLLLDEFYRSALWIAGAIPVWWLSQDICEPESSPDQLQRQFPGVGQLIQLGNLTMETRQEFFSGLLWQLCKTLDKPEKSLLKLLLTECYAREFPSPDWLCLTRKQIIHQSIASGDSRLPLEADPYLLLFRKVETALIHAPERQHVARLCFYMKLCAALRPHHHREHPARHLQETLANEWQWPETLCRHIKNTHTWQLEDWQAILIPLQTELVNGHERILEQVYAWGPDAGQSSDAILLMNRLRSQIRGADHKIDRVHWQIWSQHQIDRTRIILQTDQPQDWHLQLLNEYGHQLLESHHTCLMHLLGWLVINGFWHRHMPPDRLQTGTTRVYTGQLHHMLRRIDACWQDTLSLADRMQHYAVPPQMTHRMLLVQPKPTFSLPGDRHAIRDCTHTLASSPELNPGIIGRCELLSLNNWGEAHVYSCYGSHDLLAMLAHSRTPSPQPPLEILGFGPVYIPALVSATQRWLHQQFSAGDFRHDTT